MSRAHPLRSYGLFSKIVCLFVCLFFFYGRLARWRKWRTCDVGEAKEGLENELWRRWSNRGLENELWCRVMRRKGWRMSYDIDEVMERLENEQLQPFRRLTYITAHSPTLLLLHLRHSSFSNPSFPSLTSQVFHLIHLASRPWCFLKRV